MIDAVIFDMDGLMLDTERLCLKLWPDIFHWLTPEQAEEDFFAVCGRNRTNILEHIRRQHPGRDAEWLMGELKTRRQEAIRREGVVWKKGLAELLACLEQLGIPKAVATSTEQSSAEETQRITGLWDRFEVRIFGDMVRDSKPNPEIFLCAAQALGIAPERCMVLEDSVAGVQAGHAAGMVTVMVPDLVQPDQETQKLLHHQCESLGAVIPLLEQYTQADSRQ